MQLAGTKKVQQVLSAPGILEKFLYDVSSEELESIRSTWVRMWGLADPPYPSHASSPSGFQRALTNSARLVLKPQREGGGNNIYTSNIPNFVKSLSENERKAWICMELIEGPGERVHGLLLREGECRNGPVVSELGVFGWTLFGVFTC